MTKYKVVGVLNFFLGAFQIIYSLFTLFLTLPRLTKLYAEFNAEGPYLIPTYFVLGLLLLFGAVNLFLAFRLFSEKEKTPKKYFRLGLVLLAVSFLLAGAYLAYSIIAGLSVAKEVVLVE